MVAAKIDLIIEKGAKFSKTMKWLNSLKQPIPMSGWSARMQVRSSSSAATKILDLTTANGGITLGASDGTITLYVSGTATAAITYTGMAVYDLELIDPAATDDPVKFCRGSVSFVEEVTK